MSLNTAKALREKRANLASQAQAIVDAAEKENRELTAEENVSFDKFHEEITSLRGRIDAMEAHEAEMKALGESRGRKTVENTPTEAAKKEDEQRVAQAFDSYLRFGIEGMEPEQRAIMQSRYRQGDKEQRAAQTVTTSGGGYLIPQGFSGQLEENMKWYGGVEQACSVFTTETGNTLPWPTVDDTGNTGRLLAINTGATQTGVTYGQISFGAYKFSSDYVLVPVELLQDSAFNLDAHLASVLGTRLGRVHNTYQTTGTGSSQPKGIVAGSSSALTAAGTSSVTTDEVLDLIHSIDPAYRKQPGAGFMFNDSTLKFLRKLKDGEGRPLWNAGIAGGSPDTLFDFPYTINQDMASLATGNKPILFGALKKFMVRKVKEVTLLRLNERFADAHQIAYLAFTRMDSNMLDSGAQDPVQYITMA